MTLTLASIALSLVAQAAPVPESPRPADPVSITVSIGRGQTLDDEGSIGSGPSAGGGMAWKVSPHVSIGAEVERLGHERDTTALHWSGHTVFASANVTYHFASRGVSPYVGGGAGGAFYKGTLLARFDTPVTTMERSSASTMTFGAAGVEIPLGTRFAVSPEVRMTFCQSRDDFAPWAVTRFGVKGSVRF